MPMLGFKTISRQKLIFILGFLAGALAGVVFYKMVLETPCPECPPTKVVRIGKQKNKGSGSINTEIKQGDALRHLLLSDSLIAVQYVKGLSRKEWRSFKSIVR